MVGYTSRQDVNSQRRVVREGVVLSTYKNTQVGNLKALTGKGDSSQCNHEEGVSKVEKERRLGGREQTDQRELECQPKDSGLGSVGKVEPVKHSR